MSFQTLRKDRDSRQRTHKSFIQPSTESAESVDEHQDSRIESDGEDPNPTELVRYSDLYHGLGTKLEIRTNKSQGRGLYTKGHISRGAVVFQTKPLVAVLSAVDLPNYCSTCLSSAATQTLKRCTKCQRMMYCSSSCQNADWKIHKMECKAIRNWLSSAPGDEPGLPSEPVRCIARLLWSMKESESDVVKKEIQNLVSHRQNLQPNVFESHTHVAHSLVRYLGATSPQDLAQYGLSSASDLVDIISRFATNSFTLTTPSLVPIGVVVSPLTALANHSCDPNVAIVFPRAGSKLEEPLMKAVALKNIQPGEQLFVSYVDTTLPRHLRQKALRDTYNFTCECSLCSRSLGSGEVDPREAMWCPKGCGGTCSVPRPDESESQSSTCPRCKSPVKSQTIASAQDLIRVGQEALDKATALEITDPVQALRLTRNILSLFSTSPLTPTIHPYLSLNRLHLSLLIFTLDTTLENLDEAIRISASCVSGLRELLVEGHPGRAMAMAELGKLLAADEPPTFVSSSSSLSSSSSPSSGPGSSTNTNTNGNGNGNKFPPSGEPRLRLAHETLIRSLAELEIGYGSGGGEVGVSVRELTRGVDKELAVWTSGVRNVLKSATVTIPR